MELIAENKRTRSPFLDLGNLGLTEVPEELFECVWLEILCLGVLSAKLYEFNNEQEKASIMLENIEYLSSRGYEYLYEFSSTDNMILFYYNKIESQSMYNKITHISKDISKIENLKFISIDYNDLWDIDFITFLPNIKYVNLSNNKISLIPKHLVGSNMLLLLNDPFQEKEKVIIESLFAKRNKNSEFKFIILENNPIKKPPIEVVKQGLPFIVPYFNSLKAMDIFDYTRYKLLKLKEAELHRKLREVRGRIEALDDPALLEGQNTSIDKKIQIVIDEKTHPEQLKKIEDNRDATKITAELNEVRTEITKLEVHSSHFITLLNQLKTLLVGDGLSGKTSLLKQILQKDFDAGEPQTHGINIHPKDIEIDGESIHVKFWDFGGQEIMHGTHTFFYSKRSVYLLVLDARREGKEDYWLKHIESFGGDSPVLVVLNKIDENPSFDVNQKFLRDKYPNIKGFLRISCKTGDGIPELVRELEKQIHALEMRRTPFAKSWFEVKEALDTMGEDYISYDRYYALCHEKEVTDETAQNVLLQFLHDLGIVLAFRNLELHDTQVINPLWLTNAVYRIINSKLVAGKKGRLDLSDLDAILNDPTYAHEGFKYPRNKFLYIVKIMQEFELCYRIAEDVFIVPDLLTVEEQPVPGFDYDSALRFVLQYDFLPASVLPRFMVQLHTRIVEGEQWRTGTALEDPIFKSKAVVKADRHEKRLYLWVNGPDRDSRRNFFNFIRKTLHDIHDSFEKLTVTELVPVPGHDDIFIEYAELVGYEEVGEKEYLVGKLRRRFNVGDLLNGLEAPERRQPRRHAPVKVFVSYSHKDAEYKDELVTALAYLSRMEEIELWQDGRIEAGMEWRKEIFEKLAEAEIVICLVSSNFIDSDFCYSIELKEALEGHEAGSKIVVPIQIKTCAWQKLPFGKIQGMPPEPISSYSPRDDGWGEVFAGMEGAVKRVREKRSKI